MYLGIFTRLLGTCTGLGLLEVIPVNVGNSLTTTYLLQDSARSLINFTYLGSSPRLR